MFHAQAKRRAAGEVIATRAWRERAAAGAGGASSSAPRTATLRVRFPEGVCLQVRGLAACLAQDQFQRRCCTFLKEKLRH